MIKIHTHVQCTCVSKIFFFIHLRVYLFISDKDWSTDDNMEQIRYKFTSAWYPTDFESGSVNEPEVCDVQTYGIFLKAKHVGYQHQLDQV